MIPFIAWETDAGWYQRRNRRSLFVSQVSTCGAAFQRLQLPRLRAARAGVTIGMHSDKLLRRGEVHTIAELVGCPGSFITAGVGKSADPAG